MKKIIVAIIVMAALCTAAFGGNVDAGRIEIGGYASMSKSTAQNSDFQVNLNPFAMFGMFSLFSRDLFWKFFIRPLIRLF